MLIRHSTGAGVSLALLILVALVSCDLTHAADKPRHWAFEPLQRVKSPPASDGALDHPIDRLIGAELARHDLKPQPRADKRTLVRRVTFDLVGLPPTPEEVSAFLADESPEAWSRVVDRLLASPQYGERWGRHWLDVVRYADTGGFEADHLYPSAWKYRDYVIRSFNADKPFDRFLQEQIAGDELWPDDRDAVVATALYCIGPALAESAMVSNQLESEWLTDAADTTAAAFLGLTFGCARCHDHKYDPITQTDYYAMQAIFAASDRPYPAKIRLTRIKALNGLLSDAPVPDSLLTDPRCTVQTDDQTGFHLFHSQQPFEVHRLQRGELSKPREVVEPAFPAVLVSSSDLLDFSAVPPTRRRTTFARWLTDSNNPLPARVLVNRVWGWHFGQAIVRTPNDFGTQGESPSHPALLDWLASSFIDQGWSLKRLHRLIVLSETYRMQSSADPHAREVDPENRWLSHFPRRRLEGEAIRDAMLACAGTLNAEQFGPPVVPPLSSEELTGLFDAKGKWPVTKDPLQHTRRSVYLMERRTFGYPMFAAFDPPEVMTSCPKRIQTVVPTQALTLLNSPVARQQSAAFAARLARESGDDPKQQVSRAWLLAFARPVAPAELERSLAFLQARAKRLIESGESPSAHSTTEEAGAQKPSASAAHQAALAEFCLALFNANEFIYVD